MLPVSGVWLPLASLLRCWKALFLSGWLWIVGILPPVGRREEEGGPPSAASLTWVSEEWEVIIAKELVISCHGPFMISIHVTSHLKRPPNISQNHIFFNHSHFSQSISCVQYHTYYSPFPPCAGSSTTSSSPRRTVPHSSLHEGMTIAIDTFPWRQTSRQASRQKPLWLITWHRHSNHRPFYGLIKFLLGERGHRASEPFNSCSLSWHCKHVCCQRCCLLGLDGISMEPHME